MSVIQAMKQRTARREHRLRESVYRKHLADGETLRQATAAAEAAVQRRRHQIALLNAG